jgi:hypothetical protein
MLIPAFFKQVALIKNQISGWERVQKDLKTRTGNTSGPCKAACIKSKGSLALGHYKAVHTRTPDGL